MTGEVVDRKQLGASVQAYRKRAGLTQAALAARLGLHKQSVVKYEAGDAEITTSRLRAIAEALGVTPQQLLAGVDADAGSQEGEPRGATPWEPNPTLRRAWPARVLAVADGYLRRLAAAGVSAEQVEEIERLMLDERYAKLNKRAGREMSEEDMILLIDATWEAAREVMSWQGVRV